MQASTIEKQNGQIRILSGIWNHDEAIIEFLSQIFVILQVARNNPCRLVLKDVYHLLSINKAVSTILEDITSSGTTSTQANLVLVKSFKSLAREIGYSALKRIFAYRAILRLSLVGTGDHKLNLAWTLTLRNGQTQHLDHGPDVLQL